MAIILAYPTIAVPQVIITLADIEQLPSSRPTRRYQKQFETDAGDVVVYVFGGESSTFSLSLYPLSKANAQALQAFYNTAIGSGGVNGRVGIWQLQDSHGDIYTVRFAQDVIEPQQRGVNAWAVALTLRVAG